MTSMSSSVISSGYRYKRRSQKGFSTVLISERRFVCGVYRSFYTACDDSQPNIVINLAQIILGEFNEHTMNKWLKSERGLCSKKEAINSASRRANKENDKYFTISVSGRFNRNAESIGYFFKPIDSAQKSMDIVLFLLNPNGRIIQSADFFAEYIEALEKYNTNIKIDKTIEFQTFTSELIAPDNYIVSATFMKGFDISIKRCVVNVNGYITWLEDKPCVSHFPDSNMTNLSVSKEVVELTKLRDIVYRNILNNIILSSQMKEPSTPKVFTSFIILKFFNNPMISFF